MKTLEDVACNLCLKRDGCMPYSDDDLVYGANNGHVSLHGECSHFSAGTEGSKVIAVNNLNDFNDYAKGLVSNFNK